MYKGGSSHRVRQSVDLEITLVPPRRSVTETVAYRSEDKDLPSVSSAIYQSASKEGYPALFSRYQCAWTYMPPIGVGKVQRVKLKANLGSSRS